MRRGPAAWCATLVLAVLGTQVAHALAYRLVSPDVSRREQLMSSTGHGYLDHAGLALGLAFALLTALLATEVRAAVLRRTATPCAWPFLLVAPVLFTAQEHIERLAHDGTLSLGTIAEPAFQVGLVLQLPFALAAYGLARLLLSAARSIGRRLGGLPTARRHGAPRIPRPRVPVRAPRRTSLALGYAERGPPRL
jgi:hypothetical protein